MKGSPTTWLPEELAWIETHKDWSRADLHRGFVARWGRIDVSKAALTALCKRRGWLTGRTGRFTAGQVPMNKGQKMPFHPNSAATRFRKGQASPTYKGPGHESIDRKHGFVWLIVAETNPYTGAPCRRVQKHRHLWEKAHGPIPAGHVLKCLDGNPANSDPSNWTAIPRAMLPRLNGRFGRDFETAPAELKPAILAIARLEHAAREARK